MTTTSGNLLNQDNFIERWLKENPQWRGETELEGEHFMRMSRQARYAFLGWMLEQKKGFIHLGIDREREKLRLEIEAEGGRFEARANVDAETAFGKLYDFLLAKDIVCPFVVRNDGSTYMWVPLARTLQVLGYAPPTSGSWYGDCCMGDPLRSIEKKKFPIRGRQTVVVGISELVLRIGNLCKCSLVKPAELELRKALACHKKGASAQKSVQTAQKDGQL